MARTAPSDEHRGAGAATGHALDVIANIIETRTRAVTITRPSQSTGSLDETSETTTDHTEDLWLVEPSKAIAQTDVGERVTGDLRALGLDGIDVQQNDRLMYGGREYEIDTVVGRPDDTSADGTTHSDTNYFDISLVRRH